VDRTTEAGCATLRLEGDNDEKSCRDADSLASCHWGKGRGSPSGGSGGGGPSGLWHRGGPLSGGGGGHSAER
jgi:hypothetical protein